MATHSSVFSLFTTTIHLVPVVRVFLVIIDSFCQPFNPLLYPGSTQPDETRVMTKKKSVSYQWHISPLVNELFEIEKKDIDNRLETEIWACSILYRFLCWNSLHDDGSGHSIISDFRIIRDVKYTTESVLAPCFIYIERSGNNGNSDAKRNFPMIFKWHNRDGGGAKTRLSLTPRYLSENIPHWHMFYLFV